MIFNMTGGGAPLNFKVVPNPQPDTAKENTIWVDTDRINNYYFSATQPENMVNYDVWFHVGTSSTVEFNALKKNGIQVYPISAKQYIGGAWVDKTAKIYQGGKWVDWWDGTLYKSGNEYNAFTGGWTTSDYTVSGYPGGTVTNANNRLTMASGSGQYSCAGTVNRIDLTPFKTLRVIGYAEKTDSKSKVGVFSTKELHSPAASKTISVGSFDVTVDISSLAGLYFVGCVFTGYITEVQLIR